MVRIAARNNIRIYVYANEAGQPHHAPHCHVYWPDGSSVVALDSLSVLRGDALTRAARVLLEEHALAARIAWEELNETP
jgi:hypothetical protein